MAELTPLLESIYGLDLGTGLVDDWAADVLSGPTDFEYAAGPRALQQELERLFVTPKGAVVEDPSYGIDWGVIGTMLDPRVSLGLARLAALEALEHPSFQSRFRVAELATDWSPATPGAIYVSGVLECFGFNGAAFQFGPIALELARAK